MWVFLTEKKVIIEGQLVVKFRGELKECGLLSGNMFLNVFQLASTKLINPLKSKLGV